LDDVNEFICADSDARGGAELASLTRFRFIPGSSGSYGRNSDRGIFAHSKLGKIIRNSSRHSGRWTSSGMLGHHFIVGDGAFRPKTYLWEPYPGSQSEWDNEKSIFSYILPYL